MNTAQLSCLFRSHYRLYAVLVANHVFFYVGKDL